MHITTAHLASSQSNPDNTPPPDLDPEIYPIIATHFYGVDLRDIREVFWCLAHQGHPLPADAGVILIDGGAA